jgi:hypothetical protein
MRPGLRFGLSEVEKRDVWSRWKAGQTLHEIGRDYDKPHTSIRAVLLPRGGIPPIVRRRSRLALTLAEREDISRGIASGSSIREVASRPAARTDHFLRGVDTATLQAHFSKGILAAHPLLNLFFGRHILVGAKLLIQVPVDLFLSEQ